MINFKGSKMIKDIIIKTVFVISVLMMSFIGPIYEARGENDEEYVTVGVIGHYYLNQQQALDRINEIRKEACIEGVQDPRDPSRKLTLSDYVPIKWSNYLEEAARLRAAEAVIRLSHTRPNGMSCFSVGWDYTGAVGEVLAWNYSQDMRDGINQFYEEKDDWINMTGSVTGHYTQMIDPDNIYVGLGGFYSEECGIWPSALCGRFADVYYMIDKKCDKSTDDRIVPVEVEKNCIKEYYLEAENSQNNSIIEGKNCTYKVWVTVQFDNYYETSVLYLDEIQWTSSNESVLKISDGKVTALKAGTAKITAKTADGSVVQCNITVNEDPNKKIALGTCGKDAKWSLTAGGLMTISGTGAMDDYKYSSRTPWFKLRDKIKKVNINSGITRIGTNTFYGCTNLTEVTGCANVGSIGINAFRNCSSLTKVAGCTKTTLVEQYAFCGSNKFATIGSTAGIVNLPACEKIGGYTFYECKGIKKLVTSNPMSYIGTRSFSNCTAMTSVTVGAACKIIGSYAFCGNTNLTTVTGCAGLTGIGDFAFYGNTKLTSIDGCSKVANIGKSVFRNCKALTKVGATTNQINFAAAKAVGEYAFSGCKEAKYISLGSNLTSIGQYAFQNTSSLAKLYIKSSQLSFVGANALKGIKSNAVIYVPSAKVTAYKNDVLKGKGQGAKVVVKKI